MVIRTLRSFYRKILSALPVCMMPDFGPFNGQSQRMRIWDELFRVIGCRAIIETGSYLGTTAEYLAQKYQVPIYSSEIQAKFFKSASTRLNKFKFVSLFHGDSRDFLRHLAKDANTPKEKALFYLDAHWEKDLPLGEELKIIEENWRQSAVMIDDFEVPHDTGYGFDDYGSGKKLSLELFSDLSRWNVFWPAATAQEETGKKRGSVILLSKDLNAESLTTIRSEF